MPRPISGLGGFRSYGVHFFVAQWSSSADVAVLAVVRLGQVQGAYCISSLKCDTSVQLHCVTILWYVHCIYRIDIWTGRKNVTRLPVPKRLVFSPSKATIQFAQQPPNFWQQNFDRLLLLATKMVNVKYFLRFLIRWLNIRCLKQIMSQKLNLFATWISVFTNLSIA